MKRSKVILLILIVSVCAGVSYSAAETSVFDAKIVSDGNTNIMMMADSDYNMYTSVDNTDLDTGEFDLDMRMNNISWLNITDERAGLVHFKTGAHTIDINQQIPNLRKFALADAVARASITGHTFECRSFGRWDKTSREWQTGFSYPEDTIRTALDDLRNYLDSSYLLPESDHDIGPWWDNKLVLQAGASIQLGRTLAKLDSKCTVDDLYDPVNRADDYANDFAKCIYNIDKALSVEQADRSKVKIYIPKNSFLQICKTRVTVTEDIYINIASPETITGDSIRVFRDSAATSAVKKQTESVDGREITYNTYSCDASAVMDSTFGIINEIVGYLAASDVDIVIGEDIPYSDICKHTETTTAGKVAASVMREGFTGDSICTGCGVVYSEGKAIPKITPTLKLSYTSIRLQIGQSTNVLKAVFHKTDKIKSIKTSDSSVVTAAKSQVKSGSTVIKLKAGKKTGKATVTVTLASGKKAKVQVIVQKNPVVCKRLIIKTPTSVTIGKGGTYQIKCSRAPAVCIQKITYRSSAPKVAKISSKGKIHALKKGKAKITIRCGLKKKTVSITVR